MSKVATEMIAESYRNNELLKDTVICCMRIFTVYGPGQRKGLAIGNFIDNILQDKPITVYGDASQRRDFTYIDDLCIAIEKLLDSYPCIPIYTDIGNKSPVSLSEIIYLLSKITSKEITIKYEDWKEYDVYETMSKSNDWIPLKPTPLEEGLKNQIEWTKQQLSIK